MEAIGALGILFVAFLVLVLAVLAVLMPWYVYKIAHYQRLTYELLRNQYTPSEVTPEVPLTRGSTNWPEPR